MLRLKKDTCSYKLWTANKRHSWSPITKEATVIATKLPDFGPLLQSTQTRPFSDSLPDLTELSDSNFRVDKFAILPLPPTWNAIRQDNAWSPDTFTGRSYRLSNEAIVTLVKKDIIITA